jgi:hypothetical protein
MIEPRPEVELRLAELKQAGAHPVLAIKAICGEFGLSLSEAKTRFAQSPAWAAEQSNADHLHQQIIDAVDGNGNA